MDAVGQALLDQLAIEEQHRLRAIKDAWAAYGGDHPTALEPSKKKSGEIVADDNVILNYCRVIVDKGVSFLFGTPPDFDFPGLDEKAQEAVKAFLRANQTNALWKQAAMNGAITGHAFIRIWDPGQAGQPVRLLNLDPANVFPEWEVDDYQDVVRYRIQWNAVDPDTEKPAVYRTLIDRADNGTYWTILDQIAAKPGDGEGTDWRDRAPAFRWPYAFAPIVDCQNLPVSNEYFGEPDLTEDIIALNYRLESLASNMTKIVRLFAHPKPWARGATTDDDLELGPDEMLNLPNGAEVGALQFNADLKSSIELYERLRQALHELARVPEIATGKLENVGNLSGLALQILFQPLIEKTEDKQGSYDHLCRETVRRAAIVQGLFGADQEVVVNWPDLLPTDPLAEAQTALVHQQLGVSQDTNLRRLGFDPEAEKTARADEQSALGEELIDAFARGSGRPDEGGASGTGTGA